MNAPLSFQKLNEFRQPPDFRGRSAIVVQLWWIVQGTLFAWSPQFMYGWRRFLLRLFGAKISKGVLIRPSVRFTYPWKVTIGEYSWIGDDVTLYSLGEILIGKNTVMSQKSYLCTGSHDFNKVAFDIYAKPINIEDEVWVATDVFIAPGVTIGKGAVVGARSTVLHDLPGGMICYGNPAKAVKKRETNG
jgi:putative colanic acid biosynthesis acetyltransferase WcaF